MAKLPKDLFDGLPEKAPIVDTGNYYPDLRDPHIPELDEGKVESIWVSEQIGRPIIKAFNNILADGDVAGTVFDDLEIAPDLRDRDVAGGVLSDPYIATDIFDFYIAGAIL